MRKSWTVDLNLAPSEPVFEAILRRVYLCPCAIFVNSRPVSYNIFRCAKRLVKQVLTNPHLFETQVIWYIALYESSRS